MNPRAGADEIARITRPLKRPTVQQVLTRGRLHPSPSRSTANQRKVFAQLSGCRRGRYGIQQHRCLSCGSVKLTMISCSNRHCSVCGDGASAAWRERVSRIALDCDHIHCVVTTPHEINELYDLSEHNTRWLSNQYYECSGLAIENVFRKRYGCEVGQIQVIHTWNQQLQRHVHIHTLIPAGGMSQDGAHWVTIPLEDYEAIQQDIAIEFKRLFLDRLKRRLKTGRIEDNGHGHAILAAMAAKNWIVNVQVPHAKYQSPLGLINYLSYYVMGTAISDARIVSDDHGIVVFKTKQRSGRKSPKTCALPRQEFIDRFVSHILPRGMFRVRCRGLYSSRAIPNLLQVRQCISAAYPERNSSLIEKLKADSKVVAVDGSEEFSGERTGSTTYRCICPHDKTPMVTEARASGADTLRCLSYLKLVIAFLKGIIPAMPPVRPAGLPYHLARFAQLAETKASESGEVTTITRTVSIDYALQQKIAAAFDKRKSDLPPPLITLPRASPR